MPAPASHARHGGTGAGQLCHGPFGPPACLWMAPISGNQQEREDSDHITREAGRPGQEEIMSSGVSNSQENVVNKDTSDVEGRTRTRTA